MRESNVVSPHNGREDAAAVVGIGPCKHFWCWAVLLDFATEHVVWQWRPFWPHLFWNEHVPAELESKQSRPMSMYMRMVWKGSKTAGKMKAN